MALGLPQKRDLSVSDWDHEGRQTYARRQQQLAAEYDLSVRSKIVDVDTYGRIHYLELGDPNAPPVLFLHGVSTTAATWLPMTPSLTDEYRLIIPDRPGRGLSAPIDYHQESFRRRLVDYLPALLNQLDISQLPVVGNSLGGLQAFLLATDTDCVTALALVGGPGGLTRDFPIAFRLLTVRGVDRLLGRLMSSGDPVDTARNQIDRVGVVDNSGIPEAFYRVLAANSNLEEQVWSLRTLNRRAGSFGRMHPLYDISEEIERIDVPTTFLWGDQDAFFDPEVGQPVAEAMADASFHVLPEHGHMPWLEPTDTTVTRVEEFLSTVTDH